MKLKSEKETQNHNIYFNFSFRHASAYGHAQSAVSSQQSECHIAIHVWRRLNRRMGYLSAMNTLKNHIEIGIQNNKMVKSIVYVYIILLAESE